MLLVQISNASVFKLKGKFLGQMIFIDVAFVNVDSFVLFKYERRYVYLYLKFVLFISTLSTNSFKKNSCTIYRVVS